MPQHECGEGHVVGRVSHQGAGPVQDGEVVVFKKLTPNESRFLEYQAKHPEVKLKYWEREDASGEYVKEKK